ncbi:hypothetical protein K7432_011197 [Basidiobolus ranarum]|uniref:Uncharacterized protein n=1 Tax=Basidiobolus ranarum TaxID=34480 RepID=A0ABR2WMM2_9FUNG
MTSARQFRASPYRVSRDSESPRDISLNWQSPEWKNSQEDFFTILDKPANISEWKQGKAKCIKGPWTPDEDKKLVELVRELGAEKWVLIASRLSSRTGKQCRERWHNHLDPRIDKSPFTPEEEDLIFRLYSQMGSKWAEMSKLMPGRPDNAIKNYFNTTMQRKRRRMKVHSGSESTQILSKRNEGINVVSNEIMDPKTVMLPSFRTSEAHKDMSLNPSSGFVEQRLYNLRHDTSAPYNSPKLTQPMLPPLRFDTLMTGRIITSPQTPEDFELPVPLFKPFLSGPYEHSRPLLPSLTSSYLGLKINSPCMSSSQESPSSSSSSIGFPDKPERSSDESEDEDKVEVFRENPMRIDNICSN